ncbi:choice-of-anchor P family protein [Nocardioides sp. SYSU D00038]|uniref:choice-of-anchor P family protein n=1 Tax=Nocardioides sp. SYSU D00038 TaxID=2812554 RepID=UPI0019686275|nr:choice-of-anchor P family protein [Nocardioides sp. SYSU D00038]
MSKRISAVIVALGVLLTSLVATSAATAAGPKFYYYGAAGGSQIQALGLTVRSDLTAASSIAGSQWGVTDENELVAANVLDGLASLGAVRTWAGAEQAGGDGTKITTGSRTADVSLLGGLIRADAVETVTVATKTPLLNNFSANTQFVGLTIAGKKYAVNVAKNTTITIPGVATVILNGSVQRTVEGTVYSYGFGLFVQLLKPFKNVPAAATIVLGPTASGVAEAPIAGAAVLGGQGFSSSVTVEGGKLFSLESGPSASIATPPAGTNGRTIQNATAEVNLPGILHLEAIKSTTSGTTVPGAADVMVSNKLTGLNVLNGLITASAITTTSTTSRRGDGPRKMTNSTQFLNLKVAGIKLPVNVAPNTKIEVAGLGTVWINKQVTNALGGGVYGVQVILSTARAGLPVGANITLGAAISYIRDVSA